MGPLLALRSPAPHMALGRPVYLSSQATAHLPTLPVFLRVEGRAPIPAELEYISDAGMLIRSQTEVTLPTAFSLRFTSRAGACEADGRITRRPSAKGRLAIHFSDINETLRQLAGDLAILRSSDRIQLLGAIMDPQLHVTHAIDE